MDTKLLPRGTCLCLPVDGALISMGDGHAAQGGSEVCCTAIKAPMDTLARLSERKDITVAEPECLRAGPLVAGTNTASHHATEGMDPDLRGGYAR